MENKLSILIVNYNTASYIEQCIASIYNSTVTASQYEILVWDNNSSDHSVELIKQKFPQVILLEAKYNYGFAVGMNELYKISKGNLIMTFNPDAELLPDTIATIFNFFNTNPDTGMIGPVVISTENHTDHPHHTFPTFDPLQTFRRAPTATPPTLPYEVDWLWGTGLIARKELLGELFFTDHTFLFWEEYDLAKKIRNQHKKIVVVPTVIIKHHASVSFKFNKTKTTIARRLSNAWAYHYKKVEFGLFKAKLQTLLWIADHGFLYLVVSLKGIGKKNPERDLMICYYKAVVKQSLLSLFSGEKSVLKTDAWAKKSLNNDQVPEYPPVLKNPQ